MRRSTRIASTVLTCAAAVSAVATAPAAQASTATSSLCSTSQTLTISSLAFQPPAIFPGQNSVLTATIVNCSALPQQASVEWLGHYVGSTTGQPLGCPVIDPLLESLSMSPGSVAMSSVDYLVPGGCTASELVVTVEILQQGQVVAQRSAQLGIE